MGILDFLNLSQHKPVTAESMMHAGSYSLAKSNKIESSSPATQKTTPETKRVDKAELESAYLTEPIVFNSVNKITNLIMAAKYRFIGAPDSIAFFEEFFNEVGTRGGDTDWHEMLDSIFRHQLIYGDAWNELIPSKKDKKLIVDLDIIDPKKMDYAKDSNQKILLDADGDPVGFVQTLPFDYAIDKQKYQAPEEVDMSANRVFLPPDRVAHYRLYTVGDRFYGVGLIEPAYKTIMRKLNMEEALANAINRTGFPIRKAKIGDQMHEPTEDSIQRSVEQLKNMSYMDVLAYPYWVDVSIDEAKNPEKLQLHLDYFKKSIVSSVGMPSAFATGEGESTNRATLGRQESLLKMSLKDIVGATVRVVENQVIRPVAAYNNISPVKFAWGEIAVEELDSKAKRLVDYVNAGLIKPDAKLEKLIRNIEDLPEREISESGSGVRTD